MAAVTRRDVFRWFTTSQTMCQLTPASLAMSGYVTPRIWRRRFSTMLGPLTTRRYLLLTLSAFPSSVRMVKGQGI